MKKLITFADHHSAVLRCEIRWILYVCGIILFFVSMIILSNASKFQISFFEYIAPRLGIVFLTIIFGILIGRFIGKTKTAYQAFLLDKYQNQECYIFELKSERNKLISSIDLEFERIKKIFSWGVNNKKLNFTPYEYFLIVWENFTYCAENSYTESDSLKAQKIFVDACHACDLSCFNNNSYEILLKLFDDLKSQWREVYQRKVDFEQQILDNLKERLEE